MLFAFYGILLALSQSYWRSVFCLMLAGVCDMFDGAVAATKIRNGREKRFGIQIDSLSDLISFGVFPGIFVYIISNKNARTELIASMYVLCALIRLAYFNVLEEERQNLSTEKGGEYVGMEISLKRNYNAISKNGDTLELSEAGKTLGVHTEMENLFPSGRNSLAGSVKKIPDVAFAGCSKSKLKQLYASKKITKLQYERMLKKIKIR